MRSLGRPNREQVVTTRPEQLSTLQALDLSNGTIVADLLSRGAANILKAHANEPPEALITLLYLQALGRKPTPAETLVASELLSEKPTVSSLSDLLWILVMLPEFQLVR
jgi:hypothetical protein